MNGIQVKYIVDEENRKIAVQVDLETFKKIEEALKNSELSKLMKQSLDEGSLSLKEGKSNYDLLEKGVSMDEAGAKSVKDLTVNELKVLIETLVRETIEDEIEDRSALRSQSYLTSIEEARKQFAEGNTKTFSDLFPDV
jgi:RelB Antitoxin